MRLELTVMSVAPLRPAMARSPWPGASLRITVPGCEGFLVFLTMTGMDFSTAGWMVAGVNDLGAEERELGGLGVGDFGDGPRRRDLARVGGHDAVDVGPDLHFGGVQGRTEDGPGIVRPAPAEHRGHAFVGGTYEALDDQELSSPGLHAVADALPRRLVMYGGFAEGVVGDDELPRVQEFGVDAPLPAPAPEDGGAQQLSHGQDGVVYPGRTLIEEDGPFDQGP